MKRTVSSILANFKDFQINCLSAKDCSLYCPYFSDTHGQQPPRQRFSRRKISSRFPARIDIMKETAIIDSGGKANEQIESLLHGFPLPRRHEHPGQAETSLPGRGHQGHRHGEQIRRHQDAFRRTRQPRFPASAVREDRRRSREGTGRPPVPHGLQHALPRQPQARARAHGLREPQRLQHDHNGLPDHHRRRAQGHGRRRGSCEERRVHQGSEDRPRRHGRRRLHQPRPFQGA